MIINSSGTEEDDGKEEVSFVPLLPYDLAYTTAVYYGSPTRTLTKHPLDVVPCRCS